MAGPKSGSRKTCNGSLPQCSWPERGTNEIGTSAIQSRATGGVANSTYIFCLPGSPGACRDAWDEILSQQLDYRHGPCNFVEIMPRLDEHLRRAKAKGATM